MAEEIIVNGFDVSECYADNKMMKDGLYCFWEGGNCEDNEYCYYKECRRLEQENEKLKKEVKQIGSDFIKKGDYARELEQENKSLYEEKNCLHKIIDRLLENAGYSKDIASAEDFEDVYEDMQIKRNELIELEKENKELKKQIESQKGLITVGGKQQYEMTKAYDKCKTALEEIKHGIMHIPPFDKQSAQMIEALLKLINEVLNESK